MKPFKLKSNKINDQQGFAIISLVTAIGFILTISILVTSSIFVSQRKTQTKYTNKELTDRAVESSFAVVEASLERRMWEPPLGDTCLAKTEFAVSGQSPEGVNWTINVKYDGQNRIYDLFSSGTYNGYTSKQVKRWRIRDASDYALYSAYDIKGNRSEQIAHGINPDNSYHNNTYDLNQSYRIGRSLIPNEPTQLIAGSREIYMMKPVIFDPPSMKANSTSFTSPGAEPTDWSDFGTIIQGDRMIFAGGMSYDSELYLNVSDGNPVAIAGGNLLPGGAFSYGMNGTAITKRTGKVVFFKNETRAKELAQAIQNGTGGNFNLSELQQQTYPISLKGGDKQPGFLSGNVIDDGQYYKDTSKWVLTDFVGYNDWWGQYKRIYANFLCIPKSFTSWDHSCSDSRMNPNGFTQWKKDAGLDNVLFTDDTKLINTKWITADNFMALREDAVKCGAVLNTANTPSYEDCPIWNPKFLADYAAGGEPRCRNILKVDLSSLVFNNFHSNDYSDNATIDRLVRKVIYIEDDAEISQTQAEGLWVSLLPTTARKRLNVMIVSKKLLAVRGFQQDTSDFLTQPSVVRKIVFNKDALTSDPAVEIKPLGITLMTPQKIHLLSPFYQPLTRVNFLDQFQRSANTFKPKLTIAMDASRWENDTYRLGLRDYVMNNIAVIGPFRTDYFPAESNLLKNTSPENPGFAQLTFNYEKNTSLFYMRGLWGGFTALTPDQRQCFFQKYSTGTQPSFPLPTTNTTLSYLTLTSRFLSSALPPISSRFYSGSNIPRAFHPAVYEALETATNNRRADISVVTFIGSNIAIDFAPELTIQAAHQDDVNYFHLEAVEMDLSDRAKSSGSCGRMMVPINFGKHTFVHNPPPADEFQRIGGFTAIEGFLSMDRGGQ